MFNFIFNVRLFCECHNFDSANLMKTDLPNPQPCTAEDTAREMALNSTRHKAVGFLTKATFDLTTRSPFLRQVSKQNPQRKTFSHKSRLAKRRTRIANSHTHFLETYRYGLALYLYLQRKAHQASCQIYARRAQHAQHGRLRRSRSPLSHFPSSS